MSIANRRAAAGLFLVVGLAACTHSAVAGESPPPRAAQGSKDGDPVTIGTYRVLRSAILGEDRLLLVHLPSDYTRSALRYPVLFHLYGQQVTHYFADAVMAADRLAGAAEIPPMIVIGVANTDRYRDNLPLQADGKGPGGADAFLRFFAEELIPFVDANYRTKPYRLLAGPQAGGAFGLHALTTRPDLFNALLLRIENPFPGAEAFRQMFLDRAAAFFTRTPRLERFVRVAVESNAPAETMAFAKRLGTIIEAAHPEGFRFELSIEEPSRDFVPLVGLAPALRALFTGYTMPLEPPVEAVGAIEDYYRRLSARVGLTLEPPELILTFAGDSLLSRERMDDAITLFEFQLRLYPGSLNALWRLGETCRQLGRLEQARDFYRRFLAIQPDDAAMIRQRLAEVEREIQRIKKGPQE